MSRRKGQVRFGWQKLSPAYQKRLERNGITRRMWEDGADLRAARGHKNDGLVKVSKQQKELTQRGVRADLTPSELQQLEKLLVRPKWIGKEVRTEVAAALAQLPDPKTWKHTYITPREDGEPWTMTVYKKRSKYPITIEIPGGGGAQGEAPREVLDKISRLKIDYETDAIGTPDEEIFWTVMDTDRPAPKK